MKTSNEEILKEVDNCPPHCKHFTPFLNDFELLSEDHYKYLEKFHSEGDIVYDQETVYIRAIMVFLCASWEAFVEDLLSNSVNFLCDNVTNVSKLPKTLRKLIASKIKDEKYELSPWELADNGWREYLKKYVKERVNGMNTPRSEKIRKLYEDFLEIDILKDWEWTITKGSQSIKYDMKDNIAWIDGFVSNRCEIAHGRAVTNLQDYVRVTSTIHRLVQISSLMHNRVCLSLEEITQKSPWRKLDSTPDWSDPLVKAEAQDISKNKSTVSEPLR